MRSHAEAKNQHAATAPAPIYPRAPPAVDPVPRPHVPVFSPPAATAPAQTSFPVLNTAAHAARLHAQAPYQAVAQEYAPTSPPTASTADPARPQPVQA
ncbi:hypothetical protein N7454_001250 [Penicillium verhagenii]|nr:hypothetical protein N7454_001250 [Penicillium verhagenii]